MLIPTDHLCWLTVVESEEHFLVRPIFIEEAKSFETTTVIMLDSTLSVRRILREAFDIADHAQKDHGHHRAVVTAHDTR
jgi:hypothetical protein